MSCANGTAKPPNTTSRSLHDNPREPPLRRRDRRPDPLGNPAGRRPEHCEPDHQDDPFDHTAHPLYRVAPDDAHGGFITRQFRADTIAIQCEVCAERREISADRIIAGFGVPARPDAAAIRIGVPDEEMIRLLRRAGFNARSNGISAVVTGESSGYLVAKVCCDQELQTIRQDDGTYRAECPACTSDIAALQFVARFAVGIAMATDHTLEYVLPNPPDPAE